MKVKFWVRVRLAIAILISSHGVKRLIEDSAKLYIDSTNRKQRRALARRRRMAK